MDEHDLRRAFNQAMDSTPPPMDAEAALASAQAANRRRRNAMMGGGTAAAVAVIAAGAIALTGTSTDPGDIGPAAGSAGSSGVALTSGPPSPSSAVPGTTPPGGSTKTSWPNGQTDRTAHEGVQHARGVELLDLATAALPDGLESPDLQWSTPDYHGEVRAHQAQYADTNGGVEVWEYMITMPVGRDGRFGKLLIEVHTAGNNDPTDPCDLAKDLWGMGGVCEVQDVDGKQVGLVSQPTGDARFDQWAAYRHPDGTTVSIAQAREFDGINEPGLAELPFTTDQLLDMVTADQFALG